MKATKHADCKKSRQADACLTLSETEVKNTNDLPNILSSTSSGGIRIPPKNPDILLIRGLIKRLIRTSYSVL